MRTTHVIVAFVLLLGCKEKRVAPPPAPDVLMVACAPLLKAMSAQYETANLPARNWIELIANDYWHAPSVIPFVIDGFQLSPSDCRNSRFAVGLVRSDPHIFKVRAEPLSGDSSQFIFSFKVEFSEPSDATLFTPEFCLRFAAQTQVYSWDPSCGGTRL